MNAKKSIIKHHYYTKSNYFFGGWERVSIQKGKAADSIGKRSRLRREIAYRRTIVCLGANGRLPRGKWSSA